jgi:tetratricopeptide (TPR) repeat protein
VPHIPIPTGLAGFALKQAIEAARGDELDRLFAALGDELGETTGFSAAGLIPLREDPEVLRLIVEFLDRDVADEKALAQAIEPHVYQLDEDTPASEVARSLVEAIKRLAWKARKTDRAATVHEVRRLHQERSGWATPRYLTLEWAPRATHKHIERLSKDHAEEARDLEDALANKPDQRRALDELIRAPQQWLVSGSADLWTVVGHLAATHGLWERAEEAFLEGAERPGADCAALVAKAAEMAGARNDTPRSEELFESAREIEPDHPEVILAEARRLDDPRAQIDLLAKAKPQTPGQEAAIEAQKALAHLSLGEINEAESCGERALAAAPDSPLVREVRPVTVLIRNVARGPGEAPEWGALCEAAEEFLALRDELRDLDRYSEAVRMSARAGEVYVLAGEVGRAAEVLGDVTSDELDASDEEARFHLAQVAIKVRPELALEFIPSRARNEQARLLRAWARTETGPDEAVRGAIQSLDKLLNAKEERVRIQAALARLSASARSSDVPWSDAAEATLADVDEEELARLMKAEHLIARGEEREAENLLLAHQGDPRALELLVEIAEKAEDWTRAVPVVEALLEAAPSPARRLLYAEVLIKAGREQDAVGALAALRVDTFVPTALRSRAYALSAQQAWNAYNFAAAATLSGEWLALVPTSTAAGWAQVQALLRISEYDRALSVVDEHALTAKDTEEARVLAYLFHRALPAAEALARIVALSDSFERADEYLEGLVILSGLGATDIPADLAERRRVTFEEFATRFPDSQIIQSFPAPESPEEIEAFLREHFSEGSEHQVDAAQKVARGEAAVAVLAALSGKEVSTLWGRLETLPFGFSDPTLDDLERQDAADAIGKPAVLDPSALVIAGGLGEPLTTTLLGALPGSVVPLSVLADADSAAHQPRGEEDEEQMFAGWDPVADRPRVTVADPEWVARDRFRSDGTLALARRLREVPDTVAEQPTKYDSLIEETGDQRALLTWAASYSVAERTGFPLYSDDRYIRVLARREGISTFGTVALLEALTERGQLSQEAHAIARRRLRASGGLGVAPTQSELIEEARESDWSLTLSLRQSLLDPGAWRDVNVAIRRHIALLRSIFEADPERMSDWVVRVLDGLRIAYPQQTLGTHAVILLASAWSSESPEFVQTLIVDLDKAQAALGYFGDPVPQAFDLLLSFGLGKPEAFRGALLIHVIRKLGFRDRIRVLPRVGFVTKREAAG